MHRARVNITNQTNIIQAVMSKLSCPNLRNQRYIRVYTLEYSASTNRE